MEVGGVILRSEDVEKSAAFWSKQVGLGIVDQIPGYTFLEGGTIMITLSAIDSVTDDSFTEIVFSSEDVRETFREMTERGVSFERDLKIITSRDGKDFIGASFRDPDGHYGTLTGWVDSG